MSAVLPDRLRLGLPEEDAVALAEVIQGVSGAAFRLGVLDVHLAGPAAHAPGWLGRDAAAATGQIAAVVALARDVHGALTRALSRLERHADLLDAVRARIVVLRRQQEEDFDVARFRLASLITHPALPGQAGPAPITALRDELGAAEAARQREHDALLAELRSDAVDTAHALAAATAVVGGNGRRGEEGRVIAHLAAALPGWGDPELAARGADLAGALLDLPTLRGVDGPARAAGSFASAPAFARALLAALGPSGVRRLLYLLGIDGLAPDNPWVVLLATSLGAARTTGVAADPVGEVLDATYVGRDGDGDLVAVGMGSVLAASAALRSGGVPIRTVAAWGRQVLIRENDLREKFPSAYRAVDRAGGRWFGLVDPVAEVLQILARADDHGASAALLKDAGAWGALVGRPFPTYADNVGDLSAVVEQALAATGPDGDAATYAGLQALGAGLTGGDPAEWEAHRTTAEALTAPLAAAVRRRPSLMADVLIAAGGGRCLDGLEDTALRGLGYLSIDPIADVLLGHAMAGWASQQPRPEMLPAEQVPAVAFAVGSFVAVREYGQRLAYALNGVRLEHEAEARASNWTWAINILTAPIGGRRVGAVGSVIGAIAPFAAHAFNSDGTWDNGTDTGLVWTRADATLAADMQLQPRDPATVAAGAGIGYDRTSQALGLPLPPTPPRWSWQRAVVEGLPLPLGGNDLVEYYLDQFGYLPK